MGQQEQYDSSILCDEFSLSQERRIIMEERKPLFNGKIYVIGEIKKKEIKELLENAKKHQIKILYPEVFKEAKSSLYRIAIDDKYLGGFVSTIICWQELTKKKNPKCGYFGDVQELKNYIINGLNLIKMTNVEK